MILALVAWVASATAAVAQRFELTTIFVTGDAVPDQPGVFFAQFGRPTYTSTPNGTGAALTATLTGPAVSVDDDTCILRYYPTTRGIALREGAPVVGLGDGILYDSFESCQVNGSPVAVAKLRGPDISPANDHMLFNWWNGRAIARTGVPNPALPSGVIIREFGGYASGYRTAYLARLAGEGVTSANDQAMIVNSATENTLLARTGGIASTEPFQPAIHTFADLSVLPPVVAGNFGNAAFLARLSGPFPDVSANRSFWTSTRNGFKVVQCARATPITDFTHNPTSDSFHYSAVLARFETDSNPQSPVSPTVRLYNGVYSIGVNRPLTGPPRVYIASFAEPHVASSINSQSFASVVTLSGDGVNAGNDRAIAAVVFGLGRNLIAREGDPAPEMPPGVIYADFAPAVLVGTQRVFFRARVAGPGISETNDEALFALVPGGSSTTPVGLVVREGEPFPVATGDVRTVASIYPTLGWDNDPDDRERLPESGRACAYANDVLLRLGFTDGTQAIVFGKLSCVLPKLAAPPHDQTVLEGATVTFAADMSLEGTQGRFWKRNNEIVPTGPRVSGQYTSRLTITNVQPSDAGVYTLAFRSCHTTSEVSATTGATLTVNPCRPDADRNGTLNIDDIFIFLNIWFAGSPGADFDQSGVANIDDIFIFLNAWFAGC